MQEDSINLIQSFKDIVGVEISDEEASKYVKMGKGNIELSLNYYFNKKQKTQAINAQKEQLSSNWFQKLNEGSKSQFQVEKMIKELKDTYRKPVESSITNSGNKNVDKIKVSTQPRLSSPHQHPPPPIHQSPIHQPPIRQPPIRQPPIQQPPIQQPPIHQPPIQQPPIQQLPTHQIPIYKPSSQDKENVVSEARIYTRSSGNVDEGESRNPGNECNVEDKILSSAAKLDSLITENKLENIEEQINNVAVNSQENYDVDYDNQSLLMLSKVDEERNDNVNKKKWISLTSKSQSQTEIQNNIINPITMNQYEPDIIVEEAASEPIESVELSQFLYKKAVTNVNRKRKFNDLVHMPIDKKDKNNVIEDNVIDNNESEILKIWPKLLGTIIAQAHIIFSSKLNMKEGIFNSLKDEC